MSTERERSAFALSYVCRAVFFCMAVLSSAPVFAYIGPGAGLSIVGSIVAVLAAIVVAIFGFVWFPIRRLLKRRKAKIKDGRVENARQEKAGPAH